MKLKEIPVGLVVVGKNIRLEPEEDGELGGLMESIGKHGQLQPIIVVPRNGKYELVAGHRRLAAIKARNETTVAAVIHDTLSDADIPYLRLAENIQRKQLSPREIVVALNAIKAAKPGITIAGLAKLVNRSDAWVHFQYEAARTYDELVQDGMDVKQVAKLTTMDLVELSRVKKRDERLDVATEVVGSPVKKRASDLTGRKRERRGAYIDYTGGFAIMGDVSSMTVRVICTNPDSRDGVMGALLALKRRRLRRKSA